MTRNVYAGLINKHTWKNVENLKMSRITMWKQVQQQCNNVQSVPVSTVENTHSYGPLGVIMDRSWN